MKTCTCPKPTPAEFYVHSLRIWFRPGPAPIEPPPQIPFIRKIIKADSAS